MSLDERLTTLYLGNRFQEIVSLYCSDNKSCINAGPYTLFVVARAMAKTGKFLEAIEVCTLILNTCETFREAYLLRLACYLCIEPGGQFLNPEQIGPASLEYHL
jgi:hypothetical protein